MNTENFLTVIFCWIILELDPAAEYLMDIFIIPLFYVFIAAIIPFYIGRKRQIGFGWSWFFCITTSPIFGLIITLLSKKITENPPSKSKIKIIIGWIIIIFVLLKYLPDISALRDNIYLLIATIGYFFLGVYLIGLGKGKVYNKLYLSKDIQAGTSLSSNVVDIESSEINFKNDETTNQNTKVKRNLRIRLTGRIRIYLYVVLSFIIGFLLGWYYKLPNEILLIKLSEADSLWRKNIIVEYAKQISPFISNEYFSFNWFVFIVGSIISFLCLFFLDYFNVWNYLINNAKTLKLK
jgi:hypothetical protein